MELNPDEMERQRYNAIKATGEYLELNILIGKEQEELNGKKGVVPVISTTISKCGMKEIICLYASLKNLQKFYEQNYPAECLIATAYTNVTDLGISEHIINSEEE